MNTINYEERTTVVNPVVSIIIPVYNVGNLIYKMINCLDEQTFQQFEVILVNDGSTDDSLNICEVVVKAHANYFLFSQKNQGAFSARNLGLEKARGQYIAFLDADDQIERNYLEVLLKNCKKADIAVCDIAVYRSGAETFRFTGGNSKITSEQALNKLLIRQEINSGPCGKMFRAEIIRGIRFPSLRVYEDILFVLESFGASQKIVVTNETSYYYMQENEGTMGAIQKTPSLDIVVATRKLMEFIADRKDLEDKCLYITISHLFQYALPLTVERNYKECEFILETKRLYKKYMKEILKCTAIPWKEKIIFYMYTCGWVYSDGRVKRIRREKQIK